MELREMHRRMGGLDELGNKGADTDTKVKDLEETVEELNEKIWELDKSWKNNLVFYGVREDAGVDEHPAITEQKVNFLSNFFLKSCWLLRCPYALCTIFTILLTL